MPAPPGATATLSTSTTGIATGLIASHVGDLCPDEAQLIAEYKAAGKRLSPSRARMLIAGYLAAADRRADAADPDLAYVLDYWDETGETATNNVDAERAA